MVRCVFFDRDGVVNQSPGARRYVLDWSEFRLQNGFIEALKVVRECGYVAAVVTNQRAVAKGLISLEKLNDMHRLLRELLRDTHGLELLDVMVCPHDLSECNCRKPAPGMLLELCRRHALDLSASWMVGDAETDVEAGRRAGCRTILVNPEPGMTVAEFITPTMEGLSALLRRVL